MIILNENNFQPLRDIEQGTTDLPNIVVYLSYIEARLDKKDKCILKKDSYPSWVEEISQYIKDLSELDFDRCSINTIPSFSHGIISIILFSENRLTFTSNEGKNIVVPYQYGTVIFVKDDKWTFTFPKSMYMVFHTSRIPTFEEIYLSTTLRKTFSYNVREKLNILKSFPYGRQCLPKYFKLGNLLGKGDFGNVYSMVIDDIKFAVKFTRIEKSAIENPFNRYDLSWYEILILRDIFKPLIEKEICPNLPLMIDFFVCSKCKLNIKGKTTIRPCSIIISELAVGTFRDFLKYYEPTQDELYSSLFQIMAALYTVQLYGQIMNYDVKADNILFYNVTPGGYWKYIIQGQIFYVPNHGKLFILNDFGISRSMSPKHQFYRSRKDITFRLGCRYGMIKNRKIYPIETTKQPDTRGNIGKSSLIKWSDGEQTYGSQFRLIEKTQKVIKCDMVTNIQDDPLSLSFFTQPDKYPPFEFYNDTQDAIRTFIGGKRTTQRGSHKKYPCITRKLNKSLLKYLGKGENTESRIFSKDPSKLCAGYFITKFFVKEYDYTVPQESIISTHNIS